MFDEEKAVEGNEGDGEGGEEDARGLGRRHQLANVLLQQDDGQHDREVGGDGDDYDKVKFCTFLIWKLNKWTFPLFKAFIA